MQNSLTLLWSVQVSEKHKKPKGEKRISAGGREPNAPVITSRTSALPIRSEVKNTNIKTFGRGKRKNEVRKRKNMSQTREQRVAACLRRARGETPEAPGAARGAPAPSNRAALV